MARAVARHHQLMAVGHQAEVVEIARDDGVGTIEMKRLIKQVVQRHAVTHYGILYLLGVANACEHLLILLGDGVVLLPQLQVLLVDADGLGAHLLIALPEGHVALPCPLECRQHHGQHHNQRHPQGEDG